MLTDMANIPISVGDIVVFTEPGAGRNLPGLAFGEVIALTKAGVKVFYLDTQHRRVQRERYEEDRTVAPYASHNGKDYYRSVGTGEFVDKSPVNVRYYDDRFLIVGKI